MLAASGIGIFLIPAIFCLVEKWAGAGKERTVAALPQATGALPQQPVPAEGN